MPKKKRKKTKKYVEPECAFCFDKPARAKRRGRACCMRCMRLSESRSQDALEEAARIRSATMRGAA